MVSKVFEPLKFYCIVKIPVKSVENPHSCLTTDRSLKMVFHVVFALCTDQSCVRHVMYIIPCRFVHLCENLP